ncbi:MAG: ATP-binding cassette domain-containing protein [Ardenticatenaceae bacterium]|nr:ATP-binding cassette domain-containing protein [Anaerolineales bacterium]MCB8939101.1 ATP-binding cassette domain-containing protein [Ardenticatenaceae bacterium]MCB8974858.1 ATP-binding cassette domain-containing protein [Ardenticatenaceae bacterium]
MIDVKNLKKYYGDDNSIKAVDDVSFICPDGQITGLLGPNGAGKTTTLRMISGLIKPMAGTVLVDAHDVTRDPIGVRRALGVQADMNGVYPRLTPREQFRYYGRFYHLKGKELEARIEAIIKELNMEEIADRRAEGFSRGQRQKVVLGRALVHNPPNIIMDEPTNGLDVMAVRDTRDSIRAMRDQGRCVLFSTHYMDEAEKLCDNIAIIVGGKIVASGTPTELMARTGKDNLEDAFVALAGREGLERSEYGRMQENG